MFATAPRPIVACVCAALSLAACGRGDANLWERRFDPSLPGRPAPTSMPFAGYWQGEVFSGGVRLEIDVAQVTLALRCDSAGRKFAQASAPIVVDAGAPGTMTLQADLAGGDADCGFRFAKGDRLDARAGGPGMIDVAFGNASTAKLTKLADLPPSR